MVARFPSSFDPSCRPVPHPGEDRWAPLVAGLVFVAGLVLLVYALTAGGGGDPAAAPAAAAAAPTAQQPALTVVSGPKPAVEAPANAAPPERPHRATWAEWTGLYRPLYRSGDRAFGVSWLLLAAVHKQETAFSTAAGTYHGLNFAGCCAGPMQFNVTNGRTSTWDRFSRAFRAAQRPASYPHVARRHPSVYDDFDAMMAAARLLKHSGATRALDGRAWQAAYDYYGHDAFGVSYADVVVARARNWASQRVLGAERAVARRRRRRARRLRCRRAQRAGAAEPASSAHKEAIESSRLSRVVTVSYAALIIRSRAASSASQRAIASASSAGCASTWVSPAT